MGRPTLMNTFSMSDRTFGLDLTRAWIIPTILNRPGPITLYDALEELIDSRDTQGDSACTTVNDTVNDLSFCQEILIPTLVLLINDSLYHHKLGQDRLALEGSTVGQDQDGDGNADKISNGQWSGRFEPDGDVRGCFHGCRGANCEPSSCEIIPD